MLTDCQLECVEGRENSEDLGVDGRVICIKMDVRETDINKNKTKLLIQSRRVDKQIYSITLRGETIEAVKDFVYLGSNLSANGSEENGVRRKTGQANRV
jgi:hypothetical protein